MENVWAAVSDITEAFAHIFYRYIVLKRGSQGLERGKVTPQDCSGWKSGSLEMPTQRNISADSLQHQACISAHVWGTAVGPDAEICASAPERTPRPPRASRRVSRALSAVSSLGQKQIVS